jgi:hypothetical protein
MSAIGCGQKVWFSRSGMCAIVKEVSFSIAGMFQHQKVVHFSMAGMGSGRKFSFCKAGMCCDRKVSFCMSRLHKTFCPSFLQKILFLAKIYIFYIFYY